MALHTLREISNMEAARELGLSLQAIRDAARGDIGNGQAVLKYIVEQTPFGTIKMVDSDEVKRWLKHKKKLRQSTQ